MRCRHYLSLLLLSLSACTSTAVVTLEERERQAAADYAVAAILFDSELGGNASYNVRSDGAVVIRFDDSVSFVDYTRAVNRMRADPAIASVRATQAGREVCPLKQP